MKKNVLLLLSLLLLGGLANAQSYYMLSYPAGSGNPGGVNTDADNLLPTGNGWSQLIGPNQTQGVYSAAQALPFAFNFNGAPVTSYTASSTGYITFTAVAGNSQILAEALPSANLPDKSVSIWGMNASGANDYVTIKTFGTAPNRQLWIRFMSMTTPGNTTSFTYWSIVLEESTDNIYVVEQYGGASSGSYVSPMHSIGVQIDGTTAVSAPGSPTITHSGSANGPTGDDNKYYAFMYGTQATYDLANYENTTPNTVKVNTGLNFSGKMRNLGSENITSMTLNYTVDGGSAVTADVTGIAIINSGGSYSYTFPTAWTPTVAGQEHTIEVWATMLNGAEVDENTANDKTTFKVLVNEGITATKHVVIDEGSGAWCGHCPDAIVYLNQIRDAFGDQVIVASHHQGSSPTSDRFTNAQSNQIHATYGGSYPYGTVDRKFFGDIGGVQLNRGQWYGKVQERVSATTPVEVSIINKNWDPTTRKITFTVRAKFVDYAAGELRIGAYVIEENVRGQGAGYDQVVYDPYTGNPNHIFYNQPNPMVGYIHPDVVRGMPSGAFGSAGSITDQPAMKDATYEMDYSFTLPACPKFTIPSSSTFKPTGVIDGFNKPGDIKLIGFVAKYNDDVNDREILNAYEEPLFNIANSVNNIESNFGIADVYPNPTSGYTSVAFSIPATTNINISVVNSIGQKVLDVRNDNFAAGDHKVVFNASDLENGVYFVKIEGENGESATKKFVVIQ